jgi:hypothetical protein
MMEKTGFEEVEFVGLTDVATSKFTTGAVFSARKKINYAS